MRPNQKSAISTFLTVLTNRSRIRGGGVGVGKIHALWLVSVVACLLAVTAEPAAAQSGSEPCVNCAGSCPEGGNGGTCSPNGKGRGGSSCEGSVNWHPHPLEEGEGWWDCFCVPTGELCAQTQVFAPIDKETLGREATEVVASGGVLPADGLFFVGFRAGERVVRWKCDGSVAGRVTHADKPAERRSLGA